ncbi:uncharacterized protein LOC115355884 [Myripristis murdjan]|uniref:uncharacterized protein LOC115355884 n=1 Tax=Myripristis murdjan TaxID=586833 RepID=UPI0011761407|nr:uncharacterized protein LOC115355884 [Myripristis murdjan]
MVELLQKGNLCHKKKDSSLSAALSTTESNVMPGQTVTLHCALLTNRRRRFCGTQQHRDIRLKWVDEAGDDVLEDSQHQIWPQSPCDVTLTVALQRDDRRKFKCQATVNEEFTASEEIPLRVPGRKGRGRGMMIELDTEDNEDSGGQQEVTGVAVGVVGCVVLAAVVALFVLNRKRANRQLSDVPGDTTSADDDGSADDVTYADINLPTGSEALRDTEYQATVYASIRTAA